MDRKSTCCFTGHRVLDGDFSLDNLYSAIIDLINRGVDTFICGGAIGFDTYSAEAVLKAKENGFDVNLHIYVPCSNQSERWSNWQKQKYNEILSKSDYVDMVERSYFDGCMRIRNYKMVDASSYCICYYHDNEARPSGTGQTVRYAKKRGLEIVNLASY